MPALLRRFVPCFANLLAMRELSPRGGLARILSRGGWTKRIPQSLAKASARRNLAALTLLLTAASTIACGGTTAPAPRTS
ncbi:MAG: hypothetical protein PVJ51_11580, partial [Acidobacteriota bacterium]